MSQQFAYDETYEPPAPILRLRVGDPRGHLGLLLPGLVDTGADCSLIPPGMARGLRLPRIGRLPIMGVGGGGGDAPVYAALVEIARVRVLARLVAFEDEVIIGRDLLNRIAALLDGPHLRLELFT